MAVEDSSAGQFISQEFLWLPQLNRLKSILDTGLQQVIYLSEGYLSTDKQLIVSGHRMAMRLLQHHRHAGIRCEFST